LVTITDLQTCFVCSKQAYPGQLGHILPAARPSNTRFRLKVIQKTLSGGVNASITTKVKKKSETREVVEQTLPVQFQTTR